MFIDKKGFRSTESLGKSKIWKKIDPQGFCYYENLHLERDYLITSKLFAEKLLRTLLTITKEGVFNV